MDEKLTSENLSKTFGISGNQANKALDLIAKNKTISADSLQPEAKFDIPVANDTSGLINTTSSFISADSKSNKTGQDKLSQLEADKNNARTEREKVILSLGQQPLKEQKYFEEQGGVIAKKNADRYESQIENEQKNLRDKINNLRENNPEGLSKFALQTKIDDITRKSTSYQADLAIQYNASIRDFATAEYVASKKVEAETAYLKAELDVKNQLYLEYKDAFTKEEQRQFETQIRKEEREYQELRDSKLQANEFIINSIKSGAPASLVNEAKSILANGGSHLDVLSKLGGYAKSIDERIKTYELKELMSSSSGGNLSQETKEKISKDKTAQQATSMIVVQKAIKEYEQKVIDVGNNPTRKERKELNSYLTQVIAPALAVANGQGAMTDDEREGIINDLGVKGIARRESVTRRNIASVIQGNETKINGYLDAVDSVYQGASDNYEIFKSYKTDTLSPEEKTQEYAKQSVEAFRQAGRSDDEIFEYFKVKNPDSAELMDVLRADGYPIELIIGNIQ